jgi:hypothetical protein
MCVLVIRKEAKQHRGHFADDFDAAEHQILMMNKIYFDDEQNNVAQEDESNKDRTTRCYRLNSLSTPGSQAAYSILKTLKGNNFVKCVARCCYRIQSTHFSYLTL